VNRLTIAITAAALSALAFSGMSAQTRRGGGYGAYFGGPDDMYEPPAFAGNVPYDGRFTFARVRYKGFEHWAGAEGPGWAHDYPDADENFVKILRDITNIRPFVEQGPMVGSVLVAVDDPLLFKYPVSYLSEPGGWHPSSKEVTALRSYLLKGGFMIFDDFREGWRGNMDWTNLRQIMAAAIPDAKWVQLAGDEAIFHSFFDIDMKSAVVYPSTSAYGTRPPTYWTVYQDNDPKKRMLVLANVDDDIGESWQWSAAGFVPVSQANEIYKLGINYVVYALTH
jgi:Domain of unknown function (DUF4159)